MEFLGWLFLGLIIIGAIQGHRENKQKEKLLKETPVRNTYFGDSIQILNNTFKCDENNFYWDEGKQFWFFELNGYSYFGTFPNIYMSQQEFFQRIDAKNKTSEI